MDRSIVLFVPFFLVYQCLDHIQVELYETLTRVYLSIPETDGGQVAQVYVYVVCDVCRCNNVQSTLL